MKKLQLPSFQWISLSFSSFCCAFRALHPGQLPKKLQFACFSHCRTASFLWFHCAKGTKPNFFRPLPRFPAEFEYIIIYKQMAHGLFSLQFSRFSFALDGFCQNVEKLQFPYFSHCSKALFLWFHCAQAQFHSSIATISDGISTCHYIETDGTWLISPAIFKVFLCFGRPLSNYWKIAIFILSMGFFAIF